MELPETENRQYICYVHEVLAFSCALGSSRSGTPTFFPRSAHRNGGRLKKPRKQLLRDLMLPRFECP